MQKEMKTIHEAATALCDRWDTPLWKHVEHTAVLVHSLRTALAQPWPNLTKRDRESYQKGHAAGVAHHKQAVKAAQPEQEPEVCCGDYATCMKPCTPRGRWLPEQEQRENTKQRVLQLIKELRPAIRPMEALGKPMTTQEWFDVLVKNIEVMI